MIDELVLKLILKMPVIFAAKFRSCIDKLGSSLCSSLRHMCSTWYFKVKCCHTCTKLRGRMEPWDSAVKQQKRHNDALKRWMWFGLHKLCVYADVLALRTVISTVILMVSVEIRHNQYDLSTIFCHNCFCFKTK